MNKFDIDNKAEQCYAAIKDFDGKELKGPNSMVLAEKSNMLFFTDSGPLDDNGGLENPSGSLYVIDLGVSMLKPVLQNCLAHPWGIAINADQNILYVAETLRNRILRVVIHSSGAFYTSVFHQFSGGLGPSAITIDAKSGDLYIARFDHHDIGKADGLVSVVSQEGELLSNLIVRGFPEITGLCFDSRPGKTDNLYATESATNCFLQIKVTKDGEM
jgi:sugar lactone lactonase YvrE